MPRLQHQYWKSFSGYVCDDHVQADRYHPDESQAYLSCGSDRKLTYWDSYDASAIRVLDASEAEINAVDIDSTGDKFVCAGNDYLVKIFDYELGELECVGEGHSGYVNAVKISPTRSASYLWALKAQFSCGNIPRSNDIASAQRRVNLTNY